MSPHCEMQFTIYWRENILLALLRFVILFHFLLLYFAVLLYTLLCYILLCCTLQQ